MFKNQSNLLDILFKLFFTNRNIKYLTTSYSSAYYTLLKKINK